MSNSFDAFAQRVYVYIPGAFTSDTVVIWDDGNAMGKDDLHKLWWIARSPKDTGNRIATDPSSGIERALIGKFGIGKLASYAVGRRITHLSHTDGRYLRVSIDYRDTPRRTGSDSGGQPRPFKTPIMELKALEAKQYLQELFRTGVGPEAMAQLWQSPHWTVAVIDELDSSVRLHEGRLAWVVGNGIPLRPDFKVEINDAPVVPKLARSGFINWNLSDPAIRQRFDAEWMAARKRGLVKGQYRWHFDPTSDREATVELPALGHVSADVHLFQKSLRNEANPDEPRSYGYFLLVRGRLLNPDDEKLDLTDPSFGTFYRSQYVIRADGLDEDLLADRERLRSNSDRVRELHVLRDALYRASRSALEDADAKQQQDQEAGSLLPIHSREFFREPLTALALRQGGGPELPFDPSNEARIQRAPLDPSGPIAELDSKKGGFTVNSAHPLLLAVAQRVGSGTKAREMLRALDLVAVSERLFEGYLFDQGFETEQIDKILAWRDALFRTLASQYVDAPLDEVIDEVKAASYSGDRQFEQALAKLFSIMGFETFHDGASGKEDILIVAPIGKDNYRFIVEAKGSKDPIGNDTALVGNAASHMTDANAQHALIVAREFVGFKRSTNAEAAVLKECRQTKNGSVSIATVDVLIELCTVVRTFYYPLSDILPLLATIESPSEKLARIRVLKQPTVGFDYLGVLRQIWVSQQEEAAGDMVAYRTLWQNGPDRWGMPTLELFVQRLIALETLSGSLLRVSHVDQAVSLRQSPEMVAECIQTAVAIRDRDSGAVART